MRLVDLQPVGVELALKWEDGVEHFISLEALRRDALGLCYIMLLITSLDVLMGQKIWNRKQARVNHNSVVECWVIALLIR